ncbi:MAG: 30S ribosomal protein S1 [Anaerolineae bacterium]
MEHVENAQPMTTEDENAASVAASVPQEQSEQDVHPMAELLDAEDFSDFQPKAGEIRDGIVVSVSPTEILIDIGAKSEGVVSGRELERLGEDLEKLKPGDSVLAYVVRPEDKDGNIVLSLTRAQQERDWRRAEELLNSQEVFEGVVSAYNRGGVIVRLGKVRGFVPGSQLVTTAPVPEDAADEPGSQWAGLVGKKLQLKVIELDRRRNRLILSERQAMREWRKSQKERLLDTLKKGDRVRGRVSSLASFGAFVDLGGADGLIHLSELSWSRVNHPSEVLQVGQEVEVEVINVDRERKRIGLSLRRTQPEPWSVVHEKYAVGQLVEGTITKLASFGAFARIDDDIEGLIHISELADHHINHPSEVVKEGDKVTLRIIRIEPQRRRMGLSLKRVDEDKYAEIDWEVAEDEEEPTDEWEAFGADDAEDADFEYEDDEEYEE